MRNEEHFIAIACVQWWAYYANSKKIDPRLLMAIPNGGHRHISVARKMKEEGVRAGAPDYFLAMPNQGIGGLWIELKTDSGRINQNQKSMMALLEMQGYRVMVVRGTDEFISVVSFWVENRFNAP